MKKLLFVLSLLSLSSEVIAQARIAGLSCGTAPPSREQYAYTRDVIAKMAVSRNTGTTGIPIQVHIVQDNGSGGPSLEALAQGLANLNAFFQAAGIEFYYKGFPNYADDTDLYNFDFSSPDSDTEAALVSLFSTASDAVNIYFVDDIGFGGSSACGYAYFPDNASYSNRVVMNNGCLLNAPNGTFVHEFGHYFSLYHTHQGTENGNTDPDAENVARTGANANCDTDGDLLCDTPADPRSNRVTLNSDCTVSNAGTDIHGETYTPDVGNLMSYFWDGCGGYFSGEQYLRMVQALAVRQGHTAYSLDAAPQNVNVPTNLTGILDEANSLINLTFMDNASNEMGYIIERSTTSATAGFTAMVSKGTGIDGNAFVDNDLTANTDYWYRVKAVNGGKDDYSNVAFVSVGLIYCSIGSLICDEFVSRVQIGSIDNNSQSCASGGYENFTAQMTEVAIGNSYPITVYNGPRVYTEDECGIFVDWNQDGDFDDGEENIPVSGGPSIYTATITPPANALIGATRMRIRITWNQTATSCNIHSYGETEDYTLMITQALPVEYVSFLAKANEKYNTLEWVTETEIDNEWFVIERMQPSTNTFEPIGKIPGSGTSISTLFYDWIDWAPLTGKNLYRLKQIDYDGAYDYSDVVAVEWGDASDISVKVFPNPAKGTLYVHSNRAFTNLSEVRVFNSMGQAMPVYWSRINGDNQLELQVSHLPKGIYLVVPASEDGINFPKQWFTKVE
ncbi:MAG: GEVED domain-containing protein [Bacteroidota bacterium]